MGQKESKREPASAFGSMLGSSRRLSNVDRAIQISLGVKQLETQIDKFSGDTSDPMYHSFQSNLARNAAEVQKLRASTKKKKNKDIYDTALSTIKDASAKLQEKVQSIEGDLDSAAVETNSFIHGAPAKTTSNKRITSLSQIENQTDKLNIDIFTAVKSNNVQQYPILERKIKILYEDLEMINITSDTDATTKEKLAKTLIKFENKIQKTKRISTASTARISNDYLDGAVTSRPKQEQPNKRNVSQDDVATLYKIEGLIADYEVRVLTFEDTKSDFTYIELDRELKELWSKVSNLRADESQDMKRRQLMAKEGLKKLLQSLNARSEENSVNMKKDLGEITQIENDIKELKLQAELYNRGKDDAEYLVLDQKLRSSWAKLNNVQSTYEKVKVHKERIIKEVTNTLKELNDKVYHFKEVEIIKNGFDDDLKVFEGAWSQFQKRLSELKIKDVNVSEKLELIIKSMRHVIDEQHVVYADLIKEPHEDKPIPQTNQLMNEESVTSFKTIEDLPTYEEPSNKAQIVNNFSAIKRIERELDMIKIEIKDFKGTKENQKYYEFESALNKLKLNLEEIQVIGGTVSNARTKVLKKLNETFRLLDEKIKENILMKTQTVNSKVNHLSLNRKSAIIDGIMQIDKEVQDMDKQITHTDSFTHTEINEMSSKLTQFENLLRNIDTGGQENVRTSKNEILEHIKKLQTNLATKIYDTRNDLKEIVQSVMKIKKKVDCFHGTYKSIQYEQIENELKSCLSRINSFKDASAKISAAKEQLRTKINQYLLILDERSIKTTPKFTPHEQLLKIRNEIDGVKTRAERFEGHLNDQDYCSIEGDLFKIHDELNLLEDNGRASIYDSKLMYKDYIRDLLGYLEAKVSRQSSLINQELGLPTDTIEINLEQLQQHINVLQVDLSNDLNDDTIDDLRKRLIDLMVQLDAIKVVDNPRHAQNKTNLMKELNELSDELEAYTNQSKETQRAFDDIWKGVELLKPRVDAYKGAQNETAWIALKEEIINRINQLDKVPNQTKFKTIRTTLMRELNAISQKMDAHPLESVNVQRVDLLNQVDAITKVLGEITKQIHDFEGVKHDQTHTFLDEFLINTFLRLDNIDAKGDEIVKQAKQKGVQEVQRSMQLLDQKVRVSERLGDFDEYAGTAV